MKKEVVIGLWVVLAGVWMAGCSSKGEPETLPDQTSGRVMEQVEGQALLVIDDGDKVASYSAQLAGEQTVLGLLLKVAADEGIDHELEHYDFGDLVIRINGKENVSDRSWIYFVNGRAGDVGAGDMKIEPGDLIEWKYIEPIY